MKKFELTANVRYEMGTGASRRMRRGNRIPAILYGAKKNAIPLSLDGNEFGKQLEDESFGSRVITVNVENAKEPVVLKAVQRHPANSRILHVDFQRVSESRELQLRIPVHFINEDKCPGKKAGGIISHLFPEVEVICLPKDLPEAISVDMSEIQLGQTLHLSDLVVPEGVTLTALSHDLDQAVVTISAPRDSMEEEDTSEAEETPTEGSEAAPSGS
uniref:Large ribosomal subunit protein bL25 n=1 Tax=Candidatus Kentrum sp. SD TaxID=2126332 RepID=A0A450YAH7_9GAMM|nr:MAG: large subunit ribosomal protein L25 [Candidatus Kentron sp. SD]VFK38558.1 MAG: large subunit ribosomal protein L25 [Candidatus Kentron sp. SD]VFK78644.1 MAG: large subunit ribosomal protein L25 [Candidatus Kentron sp. SD]